MRDFKPILQSRPTLGERRLLGSAELDRPPPDGVARTVAALGLASGITATAGASAASSAGTGVAVVAKWLAIGAAAGAAVTGTGEVVRASHDVNRPAAASAHVVAVVPASRPRLDHGPTAALPDPPPSTDPGVDSDEKAPRPPERGHAALGAPLRAPATVEPNVARSTLAEEVREFDDVSRLLSAKDPNGALAALDGFARRVARPRLGPEATVLRVEALVALGRWEDARRLGERFVAENPESSLGQRVRTLLRRDSPKGGEP